MKIKIEDLINPLDLDVTGKEDWLEPVYASLKPDCRDGIVQGKIKVQSEGYGYAKVSGTLNCEPIVPCSRCSDWIPWSIQREFSVRFKPEEHSDMSGEVELNSSDLDIYLAHEGKVDLVQVIIDTLFIDLPTKLIKRDPKTGKCQVCDTDLDSEQVYGSQKPDSDNPFAVLKNIKLDD